MKKLAEFLAFSALSLCFLYSNAQINAPQLGVSFSPPGHPYDFSQQGTFMQEVANMCNGGVLFGNTEWRDDMGSSGYTTELHRSISLQQPQPFNYTDMLGFAWATWPQLHLATLNDSTNNWTNADMRSKFLQALINTADSLKPAYLFIGNEISHYWVQDSTDYMNWVSFYHEAYDSIKAHDPNIKVGTIFNYEHLSGNGDSIGWTTPWWNAWNVFDTSRMDMVGLTMYPFFKYPQAGQVPATYLDPMFSRLGNIPLVITETGWPANSHLGNWMSSPAQQVDYINSLFGMIAGKNVEVVNWLFLNHSADVTGSVEALIFNSISLRDSFGTDYPAMAQWLSHCPATAVAGEQSARPAIRVWPNPAQGQIHFALTGMQPQPFRLQIYESTGKLAGEWQAPAGRELRLQLQPGFYYFRVITEGKPAKTGRFSVADG